MKEKLLEILKGIIGDGAAIELSFPEDPAFGHFSTNVAMRAAKQAGKRPIELAEDIVIAVQKAAPEGLLEKVEAASPGFVNFWISKKAIRHEFLQTLDDASWGKNDGLAGKTAMVEFTDPNPFKVFHIGHLMSNTIGESLARLHEAAGANVLRVNYQGDVGLHVAKAVWAMRTLVDAKQSALALEADDIRQKMIYLGACYAYGSKQYEENADAKREITAINEAIYKRSDTEVNRYYDLGRLWSLDYFEAMYQGIGMATLPSGKHFDHYFFESDVQAEGLALVLSHMNVFAESEGAIVFPGEQYGLHTRVFVNSKGLPTYETKELGLNKAKFDLYHPDISIIVTGSEIIDYFKVLKKAMELVIPRVAERTYHIAHGMLRLPSGKMSSRTGDVVSAESMIAQVKERILEKMKENPDLQGKDRDDAAQTIAIGAIKYSILRQNPGQDIIFDFDKSVSFEGDSGPYIQYAYARLQSILRKADGAAVHPKNLSGLDADIELALMRKILEFPDVVAHAQDRNAPSGIVLYIYKLAAMANKFYETTPILKDEDASRRGERLLLVRRVASVLKAGLGLLGIGAPEKI